MLQPAHISNVNVVHFKRDDRVVCPRSDITARLDELLRDGNDNDFLAEYQIGPTSAEQSLEQGPHDRKPDVPAAMASLRRCHRKSPLYAIEATKGVSGCNVPAGQVLLVAPAAPLQCLGLCIVALGGQQPDLRFYIGKRDSHSTKSWVFATDASPGVSIEDETSLVAAHPVIGVLTPAMKYDGTWSWTGRVAELFKTTSCRFLALNSRWRP